MEYNKNALVTQLEKENRILLKLIDDQNVQLQDLSVFKKYVVESENVIRNMQQAFYVIVNALHESEKKELAIQDVNNIMNTVLSAAAFGLLDKSIKNAFGEVQILKGQLASLNYINRECDCPKCREKTNEVSQNESKAINSIKFENGYSENEMFFQMLIINNKGLLH